MAQCKTCGKEFHTCSSCNMNYNWEWDYCGSACLDQKKRAIRQQIEEQHAESGPALDALIDALEEANILS